MSWHESIDSLMSLDPEVIPFWEGLTRHEFLLYKCSLCGKMYWPAGYCVGHKGIPGLDEMSWTASSGRGTVFSWVAAYQSWDPQFMSDLPYVLALVELIEGPIFPTRLIHCEMERVRIGLAVEVEYVDVQGTGVTLPLFKPSP